MPFDQNWLAERLMILVPLWFSLSVHEWAHARMAFQLGDDTAALLGRMTLNPLAHIDPIGTLLLPLLGVPFGWAVPVPVQPHRFYPRVNMRYGMMLTALAGPVSNLCLAGFSIAVYAVLIRFFPDVVAPGQPAGHLLQMLIMLNVILAVFNLLPVPPLDGSRIADWLMPRALRPAWERLVRLGPLGLVALLFLMVMSGGALLSGPLRLTGMLLNQLVRLLGG